MMWIACICGTLLCCCLVASALGAEGIEPEGGEAVDRLTRTSYPCGPHDVYCDISGSVLHVNGAGPMHDFSKGEPPFWKDQIITSVVIDVGITSIGSYSFYPSLFANDLTQIQIGGSVVRIGTLAFFGTGVTSINIPDSVVSIEDHAFGDCKNLNSITLGNKVESIGTKAFSGCKIQSLTIPDNVTSIGEHAFDSCPLLTNVTLGSGVGTIGEGAFQSCGSLQNVVIGDGLTTFENSAFKECNSLASFVVKAGNKHFASVDGVLFDFGITKLIKCPPMLLDNNYTIPDSVKTIANHSFESCRSPTNVIISNSVIAIDDYAFANSALTNVRIGDSVETIGEHAFENCANLAIVVIPESVSSINSYSFSGCSRLETVFFLGSENISESTVFENCGALENVCVSPEYKSTTFCSRNVTSSPVCEQFRSMFNNCYIGTYKDGKLIQEKRHNAIEWEKQRDGCFEHQCSDEAGFIKWSICNSTREMERICVNGQCLSDVSFSEEIWAVEMEMNENEVKAVDFDVFQSVEDIAALASVEKDEIKLGIVVDEKAYIVKVIAYVESERANKISQSVSEICIKQSAVP